MIPNEQKRLKNDVLGMKRNIYGKRGEVVRIVSVSLPAVIVENVRGERFPVEIGDLG